MPKQITYNNYLKALAVLAGKSNLISKKQAQEIKYQYEQGSKQKNPSQLRKGIKGIVKLVGTGRNTRLIIKEII